MNLRVVGRVLGLLIVATGCAMALPLLVCLLYGEEEWPVFLLCLLFALAAGGTLSFVLRGPQDLRIKDGFLIVSFGWLLVGVLGGLPFWASGAIPDPTDAVFESISGFTTTGASILRDIEGLGHGVLLWRALIQWLGGMGIVVLSIAILPILGVGGMQLFKAEAPGPAPDRLTPRIKETAKLLWTVYVIISAGEVLALLACGMGLFDAVCHTFTTMATGGFSTRNASVGAYDSASVDLVVTFFMFLAGANFSLHYAARRGSWKAYFRDGEFRVYLSMILLFTLILVTANLTLASSLGGNLRHSLFQVVSIMTTTGFATADFEQWSSLAQFCLVFLMFVGGCAGSTGGGMKNVRFLLLTRHAYNELRKLLHPRGVYVIRYNDRAVPQEIVTNILGFFLLLVICTLAATFVMTLLGLDLVSAISSVAATINNIGPGLGAVGPTDNFADVPSVGKWVLIFCMLLGRLELYTVLVLITPDFWRRV